MSQEVSNKIFTIPNLITLARLLLLPVFVVLLLQYQNDLAAFIVFLLAAGTDFIDGYLARSLNQVSKLGQQLDPLVDRLLILSAVVVVFIVGRVPVWLLVLLIVRDVSMLILTAYMKFKFDRSFKVVFIGKVATAFNMTGFCFLILNLPQLPGLGLIDNALLPGFGTATACLGIWMLYIGTILAWIAGAVYIVNGTKPEQQSDRRRANTYGNTLRSDPERRKNTNSNLQTRLAANDHQVAYSAQRRAATHGKSQAMTVAKSSAITGSRVATGQPDRPLMLRLLNTPKKMIIAIVILAAILASVLYFVVDAQSNIGTIHPGVKVGNIDVGGLTPTDAATKIDIELGDAAAAAPVNLFASKNAKAEGINANTVLLDKGVQDYQQQEEPNNSATSWSLTPASLDVNSNGIALANAAYAVGRDQDFLPGRLAANLFGVTIAPSFEFSESKQINLENQLTAAIGTPMVNANISFDGNQIMPIDGSDGYVVDEAKFRELLNKAFLGEDRDILVPMIDRKMRVDLSAAQAVAEQINQAIIESVTISYGAANWQLNKAFLGNCISSVVEETSTNKWKLLPQIDPDKLQAKLPEVVGDLNPGDPAQNAKFEVVDDALQISPSTTGTGISYKELADQLTRLLFSGSDAEQPRKVQMYIGTLEPDFTTAMAKEHNFPEKIAEFTTYYWGVTQNKVTNIHLASDLITSSIIEPGAIWSFNDTAGNCTAERGFQEGRAVLNGELVADIGGGICQVATTVYNAVYDAGYPIADRTNHSMYVADYPDGRDAAIAYPYADLKFENDTKNQLLLVVSYDDVSVTVTLWGVNPGYTVESVASDWIPGAKYTTKKVDNPELKKGVEKVKEEGEDGKSISVTRTVYNADGSMKRQSTIWSTYEPTKEIIELGTKE